MSALLAAAGVILTLAGLLIPPAPWVILWAPGNALLIAAYIRHTDPARRAQRRRQARCGYITRRP